MAAGGRSFGGEAPNDPTVGTLPSTSWVTLVPAFSTSAALRRGSKRSRRWTGGTCRNADNVARTVQVRLNDGTTQSTIKSQTLEAGDTWQWTNDRDGVDLARAQAVEVRTTTTPTTALIVLANFVDG